MGRISLNGQYETLALEGNGPSVKLFSLSNDDFNSFCPAVLGLGDISSRSVQIQALSAVFDLSGFTNFSSQVDPHLSVPEYLSRFLDWLFDEIKAGSVKEKSDNKTILWSGLPFLAKFLGDGVLFLWDTQEMSGSEMCNIVTSLWEICANYQSVFYPEIKRIVTKPPDILRCGTSRGTVVSVGNGEDFVGPCINISARLQKLSSLTFCVARRGFDFVKDMPPDTSAKYVLKSVSLRGIGDEELIWVRKDEYNLLQPGEKAYFTTP